MIAILQHPSRQRDHIDVGRMMLYDHPAVVIIQLYILFFYSSHGI